MLSMNFQKEYTNVKDYKSIKYKYAIIVFRAVSIYGLKNNRLIHY